MLCVCVCVRACTCEEYNACKSYMYMYVNVYYVDKWVYICTCIIIVHVLKMLAWKCTVHWAVPNQIQHYMHTVHV